MSTRAAPAANRRQVIVGASIGHVLEWYDWVVYLVLSPFFAAQFFGAQDPVAAQLGALAVFAVGFVVRPLGGLFFGWLADRSGRRASMTTAMVLTAAATLLIGLAPTYADIGVAAAVLLVLARVLQGFGLGGEVAGAYVYLAEMAPPQRRGLWSSSMYVAVTVGVTLATVVTAVLVSVIGEDGVTDGGWRLPFIAGALLGVYAFYLRRTLVESPMFEAAQSAEQASEPALPREVWRHRAAGLRVLAMTIAPSLTYYQWSVSASTYAINVKGIDAQAALWTGVAANLVFMALLPFWGWVSDRWGRKPNLYIYAIGLAVLTFPLTWLIQDQAWQLGVAMAVALSVQGAFASIGPAIYAEQFPVRVRATGFALPYSISVAVFGGTAPYLQAYLASQGQSTLFSLYVIGTLVILFVTTLLTRETKGMDLS